MSDLTASYELGCAVYKKQRGKDYVLKSFPSDPPSVDEIAKLAISRCYGDVWSRPGLDMRTRAFITITVLATIGALDQLKNHILGAHDLGITKDEIVEWLVHLNSYIGTPKATIALSTARAAWKDMAEKK